VVEILCESGVKELLLVPLNHGPYIKVLSWHRLALECSELEGLDGSIHFHNDL